MLKEIGPLSREKFTTKIKITTICYHENIFIALSTKHLKNLFYFEQQNHVMLAKDLNFKK